jgi:hypothetical protein
MINRLALFGIIIAMFLVIGMSGCIEYKNGTSIDRSRFFGVWKLIDTSEENSETDDEPGVTGETDALIDYETYEFLSNGTYYHNVDDDNFSGTWKINSSLLFLITTEPDSQSTFTYEYYFFANFGSLKLTSSEDPEYSIELEKIVAV